MEMTLWMEMTRKSMELLLSLYKRLLQELRKVMGPCWSLEEKAVDVAPKPINGHPILAVH